MLNNQKVSTIIMVLKHVLETYKTEASQYTLCLVMVNWLANVGVVLNVTSTDEYVLDIERHIRTIKERRRATCATLLFNALPPRLVIEMVYAGLTDFQFQVAYLKQ